MAKGDRRLEERHDVHIPVYVITGEGKPLVAIMCDLSRSGGRLRMGRQLTVGSDISVKLANSAERTATVRRCVPVEGGRKFDVGIELVLDSWPEDLFSAELTEML